MTELIRPDSEYDIKRVSKEKYLYRQTKNKPQEGDLYVNVATVRPALNNIGIR